MKQWKRIGITLLKLTIGLGAIGWLIHSGRLDLSMITGKKGGILLSGWLLIYLFKPLSLMMLAWRWRYLLKARGINISFRAGFRLTSISTFFSLVLPGMAAGDLVKLWDLSRNMSSHRTEALSATIVDRIIGTYGLFLLGTIASGFFLLWHTGPLSNELIWILSISPFLFLFSSLFLFITLNKFIFERLLLPLVNWSDKLDWPKRLFVSLNTFRGNLPSLTNALGISVLNHGFNLILILFVGQALGIDLTKGTQILLNILGSAGNLIPVSPGGIGITEGIFSYLYDFFGSGKGAALSLINRILNYIIFIGIGLPIYVGFKHRTNITLDSVAKGEVQEEEA